MAANETGRDVCILDRALRAIDVRAPMAITRRAVAGIDGSLSARLRTYLSVFRRGKLEVATSQQHNEGVKPFDDFVQLLG
jgi:hypothetical protein